MVAVALPALLGDRALPSSEHGPAMTARPRYPRGHRRPGIHGMRAIYCPCGEMYRFDPNRQEMMGLLDRASGWYCPEAERLLAEASR